MAFNLLFGPAGPTFGAPNVPVSGTAPTITTTSLPAGTVGVAYSQTLTATGSTPITWTITSGSISPLTLNASTGAITGTPTTTTTLTATFRATNAINFNERSLSISVSASGVAPTITTTSLPAGTVGTAYSQTLAATGSTPITWSIASGSISPLSLNASTGAITGTPTTATTLSATFRATNSINFNERPLTITVSAAAAPTVTTTSLPGGTVGSFYSQTLTATGGTPITWTLQAGTLPAGLSLSSSGVLSGTPTTAATTTGLVFTATNSAGSGNSGSLSITISAAVGAPVLVTAPTITVWRAA